MNRLGFAAWRAAARLRTQIKGARSYSKFENISEFNKSKKDYKYGHGVDEMRGLRYADVDSEILNDPRLQALRHNSPEYKETLFKIQEEARLNEEEHRSKWERQERLKGLGAGALVLIAVISGYAFVMNYKYLKSYLNNVWTFDIDDSKAQDMSDTNVRSLKRLTEKLASELAQDPLFAASVKSSETPGLYLFGSVNGKKLPSRVLAFDGMYISDVLVSKDYVVVVDAKGGVHHYSPSLKRAVQVQLPEKIERVCRSGDYFVYVPRKSSNVYYGKKLQKAELPRWFGSNYEYGTVKGRFDRGERVSDVAAGQSHALVLTSKGRLFQFATSFGDNKGQYGLPAYAPFEKTHPDLFELYELKNLNNEVVSTKEGKYVRPRAFKSVALGEHHNLALDTVGNVWAWGDNSFGQCGRDVGATTDVQPVPRLAFSAADMKRFSKYSLPAPATGSFAVSLVHAGGDCGYVVVKYGSGAQRTDMIMSFGNGLKGQSGTGRFVHVASAPSVLKSLVGLAEYDETAQEAVSIGIRDVSVGASHVFVTLDNAGGKKDVLVFGDNERGQFGNGKRVKSSRPIQIPKLIEPEDLAGATRLLARKLKDTTTNRFLVERVAKGEQVVVAGDEGSAIFYRRT